MIQLVAVYGLCSSLVVLLFSAYIGNLVDRWSRLQAAYVFLIVQNAAVCVTSIIISLHIFVSLIFQNYSKSFPMEA